MCRRQRGASYRSQSDVSHGHARGEQTLLSAQRQQIIVWLLWNTCIRDQKNPAGFLALCRKLPMTRIHICIHIDINIYIYIYICFYIYIYSRAVRYVCTYLCTYIYVCTCIYMCVCIYIYVYIYF